MSTEISKIDNPLCDAVDYVPSIYASLCTEEKEEQQRWHDSLEKNNLLKMGEDSFVSQKTLIMPNEGRCHEIGDNSWIGANCIVRGYVRMGDHCSFNPGVITIGKIVLGDGVRVAAGAQIMAFNHGYADPEIPFHKAASTYKGIIIEDDVWIGANVVITDGVTVGAHSILGAGTVVTKDVPPYSIVGGVPGKVIRNRLHEKTVSVKSDSLIKQLENFGKKARTQLQNILQYHCKEVNGELAYFDYCKDRPDIIAWCQAVELAALFDEVPQQMPREDIVKKLQEFQDEKTGLFIDPWSAEKKVVDYLDCRPGFGYEILGVGYALEALGEKLLYPIKIIEKQTIDGMYNLFNTKLNFITKAWGAGGWIDTFSTGIYLNIKYFDRCTQLLEPLFGWLNLHASPSHGLWGVPDSRSEIGWLHPVNGFYRLTRGTYAQFGIPIPYPVETIDTILAHARNTALFAYDRGNCCNTLDVAHPLWLAGKQTDHRREEAKLVARKFLQRALDRWVYGEGFSFTLEEGAQGIDKTTVKMTEQWLSTIYLLASILGLEPALGYKPKGIHRTEVALDYRSVISNT